MTRSVIFDLDGTLADTSGDLLAAANACFLGLGLGELLTRADAGTALRGGRAMLRLGFSRLAGGEADEAAVNAEYPKLLRHYDDAIDVHTRMYPRAMEAVEALKSAGFAVAICTNKPEGLAEKLMRSLGHRSAFGALVGADTTPVPKPDPTPYFEAVARVGGDPALSFLVGDSMTDERTARAAGVASVSVSFSPDAASRAEMSPDAWLDDYADLPALAARLIT
ncbi:MAG: HAD hydrolase-like protein [Rhodobacteraceae bacterium]|nr:HAD hydrolase-like protein [Paracoccaceae bacterium]